MNNTHKLILVKKDNTLHLIPPETCKNISTIGNYSLEALSVKWHSKNNIQIVIEDITYNFTIYDYLILSEKFQRVSNEITKKGGSKNFLDLYLGWELAEYEHKKITPFFFKNLLNTIYFSLKNENDKEQIVDKIFLFLKRLLKIMPHRFTPSATLTAEYFLLLEKNLDKKTDLIKNHIGSYKRFSHYQNLLNSWDKLIDESYIKQGYLEEDIDECGSLSNYMMKKRTSVLK